MIINKNSKSYLTRSDKTNENWLGDDNYFVVDDSSPLAQKIIDNHPYINFITENGFLVDVEIDVQLKQKEEIKENIISEIKNLKQKLSDTDYQAIKYAEGQLSEEEYQPIKEQRQAWRDRINELEASLEVEADGK